MPFINMSKVLLTSAFIGCALLASGCAPKLGGNDYASSSVGEISQTEIGTITSKRVIRINASEANKPGVGAMAGGIAGALAGSTIGQGKGSTLASVIGGLAGGFGGHALEQNATAQDGFEYQVRLSDGSSISITQGAEPALSVGQRVKVIVSKSRSRVIPA